MERGYIALWRKSIDSQIFQHEGLWKLWTLCLMKATHKEVWTQVKDSLSAIKLIQGQFVTGRFALHKEYYYKATGTRVSPLTLWRWLQKLENMRNLNIKTNNKYSIITIINWDTYQIEKPNNVQHNEQQVNNRRTTGEQQVNTYNNTNNTNKKKLLSENSIEFRLASYLYKFILRRNPNHKKPDLQKWAKDIDLMIRIDNRDPEDIKKIIKWCQEDTPDKQTNGNWKGWANNILSAKKLREKYDKLLIKMEESLAVVTYKQPDLQPQTYAQAKDEEQRKLAKLHKQLSRKLEERNENNP